MILIKDFPAHVGHPITGVYRVLSVGSPQWSRSDFPTRKVMLGDHTGTAHLVQPVAELGKHIHPQQIVQADIHPRILPDGAIGGLMIRFKVLLPTEVDNIVRTIPKEMTPAIAAHSLMSMFELISLVRCEETRKFAGMVIDCNLSAWLNARGGWKYHHDEPGGLLIHSVNVAEEARGRIGVAFPMSAAIKDAGTVTALLHDLGKCHSINKVNPTPIGRLWRHENVTLALVYRLLNDLHAASPERAKLIAEGLELLAGPANKIPFGHWVELIRVEDAQDVRTWRAFNVPDDDLAVTAR